MTYRIVNETGLGALKYLARTEPALFAEPDAARLEKRMNEMTGGEEIWGSPLPLQADMSPLEEIAEGGPGTDAAFAPIVRAAMPSLKPSEGLNEYVWATVNCFVVPKYTPIRWSGSSLAKDPDKFSNFVEAHWLRGNLVTARRANAAARLWWLGELSSRAAEKSGHLSADDILDAMANNVNLYHQLLSRPNLLSRPRLVAAIYEMFLDGDSDHLKVTTYANRFLGALNLRAADVSLDLMNDRELRDAVEEAKPPKGR